VDETELQDKIREAQDEAKLAALAVAYGTIKGASAGFKLAGFLLEEGAKQITDSIEDAQSDRDSRRLDALVAKRATLVAKIAAGPVAKTVRDRLAAVESEMFGLTGETPKRPAARGDSGRFVRKISEKS